LRDKIDNLIVSLLSLSVSLMSSRRVAELLFRPCTFRVPQEFPITDFNLEERVLSRTVAKKLSAEGVDIESLGLEPFDEPLLYDLCECSSSSF